MPKTLDLPDLALDAATRALAKATAKRDKAHSRLVLTTHNCDDPALDTELFRRAQQDVTNYTQQLDTVRKAIEATHVGVVSSKALVGRSWAPQDNLPRWTERMSEDVRYIAGLLNRASAKRAEATTHNIDAFDFARSQHCLDRILDLLDNAAIDALVRHEPTTTARTTANAYAERIDALLAWVSVRNLD